MKYIVALDQGTTSSRAILFDQNGQPASQAQQEFHQIYPQPGWVEHNADEIWLTQLSVLKSACRKIGVRANQIAAIGITNQRETVVVWDRQTGKPVANAIVWQDRRTADDCLSLRNSANGKRIRKRTGLVVDAYFSASKVRWLLRNVKGLRMRAKRGELAFGTIDSWLIWNLTGGRAHVTDPSNASRTMLFNLKSGSWDRTLLDLFEIPESMLPRIVDSSGKLGETSVLGRSVPIAGIAGDQQAALFGQGCHRSGMSKNTYGTGCFMCANTGPDIVMSKNQLLTSVAWRIKGRDEFMLEGSVFVAGAAVQWLRDELGIIRKAAEIEPLAASVSDSNGVCFVPAFTGLGAPHWDQFARGALVGLTRGTNRSHLARAALEGIAFQVAEVVDAMETDAGKRIRELRVDGGASANNLLMQIQSDILGKPVTRSQIAETTALGAAYLAGLGVGFWNSKTEIAKQWKRDRSFKPNMKPATRKARRAQWSRAVERARDWETNS